MTDPRHPLRSRLPLAGLLLLGLLTAACTQPPVPRDTFYRLDPPVPQRTQAASQTAPLFNGVVEVGRFTADGVVGERSLAFSEKGGELTRYSYHYWAEPPTDLLQRALADHLRASGLFSQTVTPELRVPAAYEVQGRVRRFEQLRGGETTRVALSLSLSLTDIHHGRLIHLGTYDSEQPAADASPAAAVAALRTATAEAFQRFTADLRQAGAQ
ncbi:ABC-type transport auxiliary lipoprotein family protein [Roseospirillum parvum]|uniref:ABC-type uncharacterized transport system, auxiliary component n=1 Tax=Roseospirillum parvum TaxID=83401 RepID=A0A1G8CIH0_9PROT|nr:ABC-type transport auxiliary lipoprotein family protein [Roseospirillum parvum]SDH45179.1 ABC-type uncharacterized transport system, auxiliary component [Roseospirillum parvum]